MRLPTGPEFRGGREQGLDEGRRRRNRPNDRRDPQPGQGRASAERRMVHLEPPIIGTKRGGSIQDTAQPPLFSVSADKARCVTRGAGDPNKAR